MVSWLFCVLAKCLLLVGGISPLKSGRRATVQMKVRKQHKAWLQMHVQGRCFHKSVNCGSGNWLLLAHELFRKSSLIPKGTPPWSEGGKGYQFQESCLLPCGLSFLPQLVSWFWDMRNSLEHPVPFTEQPSVYCKGYAMHRWKSGSCRCGGILSPSVWGSPSGIQRIDFCVVDQSIQLWWFTCLFF